MSEDKKKDKDIGGWITGILTLVVVAWIIVDDFVIDRKVDWSNIVQQSSLAESVRTDIYELEADAFTQFLKDSGFWNVESGDIIPAKLKHLNAAQIRDIADRFDDQAKEKNFEYGARLAGMMLEDSIERHAFIFKHLLNDQSSFLRDDDNRYMKANMYLQFMIDNPDFIGFERAVTSYIQTMSSYQLSFFLSDVGYKEALSGGRTIHHPDKIAHYDPVVLKAMKDHTDSRTSFYSRIFQSQSSGFEDAIELIQEQDGN